MVENDNPKTGEAGVPLWIKVMWFIGVAWIIWYIAKGLSEGSIVRW